MLKMKANISGAFLELLENKRLFLRPRFDFGNSLGTEVQLLNDVFMEPYSRVSEKSLTWGESFEIGAFSYVVPGSFLPNTSVGRFCSIGVNAKVMGENHPIHRVTTSTFTYGRPVADFIKRDFGIELSQNRKLEKAGKTIIGNDVWVGENVTFKRGVTIGDGAIIASNSVITRNVAPYSIVGGNPAKFIKDRFDEETQKFLISSEWWNQSPQCLASLDMTDIELFKSFYEKKEEYIYPKHNLKEMLEGFYSE
jgi:acetyltransferase-like isoleucine patch superfamily enzyme